ncbi:MAG TPA: deoxyhypusine synthase family protein [Candidatus Thermoplasmatota archaeon]
MVREDTVHPGMTVAELVRTFGGSAYNARRLANAVDIWAQALEAGAKVYLTLAGAMTPAGLRRLIGQLAREGLIHAVISTGANLAHDAQSGAQPGSLVQGSPQANDSILRENRVFRIYDVFVREDMWDVYINEVERQIIPSITKAHAGSPSIVAPSTIFRVLGEDLLARGDDGVLASCAKAGVPVYSPAIMDSEWGIQIHEANRRHREEGYRLVPDQAKDLENLVEDMRAHKERAVVVVGGGSPKNFTLQSSLMVEDGGFRYAVQFTTDAPHWGGLSGATLSEAISWGKIDPENAKLETVYSDATITFPIAAAAVMDRVRGKAA